jgi:hypothetical protein
MEVFLTQDAHKSQVRNNKGRATSRVLTVENEQAGRLSFSKHEGARSKLFLFGTTCFSIIINRI